MKLWGACASTPEVHKTSLTISMTIQLSNDVREIKSHQMNVNNSKCHRKGSPDSNTNFMNIDIFVYRRTLSACTLAANRTILNWLYSLRTGANKQLTNVTT